MSDHPPFDQVCAAKHRVWRRYYGKPWFGGCRYNTDEDEAFLELLCDADYKDRFTYIIEEHGVRIVLVKIPHEQVLEHRASWEASDIGGVF